MTNAGRPAAANPSPPLRLAEFAMALSLATDLGLGHLMEMVLSTCRLAVRLAECLGLPEAELAQIYYLALFRHAGCAADATLVAEAFGDELTMSPAFLAAVNPTRPLTMLGFLWRHVYTGLPLSQRLPKLATAPALFQATVTAHCESAELFASRVGLPAPVPAHLRLCNENWNGTGVPGRLKGEALPRTVRTLLVAEEAIYLQAFVGPGAVVPGVRQRGGVTLDPAAAEVFCAHAEELLRPVAAGGSLRDEVLQSEPGPRPVMTDAQLEAAAAALADFADLKSPFTIHHSAAVAGLVGRAARQYGLPEAEAAVLRRAGHVHDVGRVGVTSSIWAKPAALTEAEWERVRLAPYYTSRILAQPAALAQWGTVAAAHHERLDGSGYFRSLPAALLAPGMRLLAAADAYQAMTEVRPHRPALTPEQAADELKREARAGLLDGDAVRAVLAGAGQTQPGHVEHVAGLTGRELEVLRLVARGLSNKQIAARLVLSQKTVGNHLQNIYGKLDVTTRAAATYFAMQHALV
jgi:HD-GYP domain-containing protein (c-di-GMP phosphodiesterase class II)